MNPKKPQSFPNPVPKNSEAGSSLELFLAELRATDPRLFASLTLLNDSGGGPKAFLLVLDGTVVEFTIKIDHGLLLVHAHWAGERIPSLGWWDMDQMARYLRKHL